MNKKDLHTLLQACPKLWRKVIQHVRANPNAGRELEEEIDFMVRGNFFTAMEKLWEQEKEYQEKTQKTLVEDFSEIVKELSIFFKHFALGQPNEGSKKRMQNLSQMMADFSVKLDADHDVEKEENDA
jgi:hypothetical protein